MGMLIFGKIAFNSAQALLKGVCQSHGFIKKSLQNKKSTFHFCKCTADRFV
jgi:hypothetical protein